MLKRSWFLIMAALLLLTLAACSGGGGGGHGEGEESEEPSEEPIFVMQFDRFENNVVGIKNTYVMCQISMETENAASLALLEQYKSKVRDQINNILRRTPLEELEAPDALSVLAEQIRSSVTGDLALIELRGVYFDSFYITYR